jgi:hypothetical protein
MLSAVASAIHGARSGSAGLAAGVSQGHPESDDVAPDGSRRAGLVQRNMETAWKREKRLEANGTHGFSSSLRMTLGTHGVTYRSMQGRLCLVGLPSGGGGGLGAAHV